MPQELFDPKKMMRRAERLKKTGKMPSFGKLLKAMREVREELRAEKSGKKTSAGDLIN